MYLCVMSAVQPIGWSSSRLNMHFKAVIPQEEDGGMQTNLHKNMTKRLLPREISDESLSIETAKRILHRQKLGSKLFVGGTSKLRHRKSIAPLWQIQFQRAGTSPEKKTSRMTSGFLPPVNRQLPFTPNSRYSADDVSKLIRRLSTFDPEKIPESKGFPMKLPTTIVYKKKYSEDEIQKIVDRLSNYDSTKFPAESKGAIPLVVKVTPRQTFSRVKKSSSADVQDVVEQLSNYDNTRAQTISRGFSLADDVPNE